MSILTIDDISRFYRVKYNSIMRNMSALTLKELITFNRKPSVFFRLEKTK